MQQVVVKSPVIEYFLAKFRDKDTTQYGCNICAENISYILASEVSKYLNTSEEIINTPLGQKECTIIDEKIVLVPILRAGVSMLSGFQRMLPKAMTAFVWAHRDENANAVIDKYKMPMNGCIEGSTVVILDTVIATAGTVNACVHTLSSYGPRQILLTSLFATEVGINSLNNNIDAVIMASMEDGLNEHLYIIPGVGDAGDRLYG